MKNKSDIIGLNYGHLTVIRDSGKRNIKGEVIWECICDRGQISYVRTSSLTSMHIRSCGYRKNHHYKKRKSD